MDSDTDNTPRNKRLPEGKPTAQVNSETGADKCWPPPPTRQPPTVISDMGGASPGRKGLGSMALLFSCLGAFVQFGNIILCTLSKVYLNSHIVVGLFWMSGFIILITGFFLGLITIKSWKGIVAVLISSGLIVGYGMILMFGLN